jgi:hypothetical protein
MKKTRLLIPVMIALSAVAGIVLAQGNGTPEQSFAAVREIGRVRPQGIQYDPHFDRFVMVDPLGRLLVVDAATSEVQHVLYETGSYNAYTFSHDGRWLALAIDRRVELWDTQTGTIAASVEPDALYIQGPLQFSDDDNLLLINAVVPAPVELRRSENDTVNLPHLWDIPSARDGAVSRLPQSYELYPFYDYLFGFVLGPNHKAIGALPQRLQLIDVANTSLPVLTEVASDRYERDPISVWFSLRGDQIYVLPQGRNVLVQLNSETGAQVEFPLGWDLSRDGILAIKDLVLSDQARIIGEPHSRGTNSFLRLLLGEDYPNNWNYHPLTVILIDILQPVTVSQDQMGLLIYVMDDETGRGALDFVRPTDVMQMTLHPDNKHLAIRRASGAQSIEVYNLDTGVLEKTYVPALPDPNGTQILSYNATGDVIVCDFQRFDAATGTVLHEDLNYVDGFDDYFFTQDSRGLVTLNGSAWWQWDIASGQVIRREHVTLRGSILDVTPDAHRFLTRIDTEDGALIEVVDVGMEQRRSVLIKQLPGYSLSDIVPSPNWENYIAVYSGDYNPGAVALYNLYDGQRWFLAYDDLPSLSNPQYGWVDNRTAYIVGEGYGEKAQAERVFGVDYDSSGLPACLVKAFPGDWRSWLDLWERLNARLDPLALDRLARKLCAAVPGPIEGVNAILYPSPTPSLPPITATPAKIAGVPVCLTARFPDEAVKYAAIWREISAGLSPEDAAALEQLLCEGLSGASLTGSAESSGIATGPSSQVMTVNMETGMRAYGGYIPQRPAARSLSLSLVLQEFKHTMRFNPPGAKLSPDGALLAVQTPDRHIVIYRLLTPYDTLAATATATFAPPTDQPRSISVLPAATRPFEQVGEPRPTMTPTITPTAPPRPIEFVSQPDYGQVQELCPSSTRYDISTPPPGYSASGYLLAQTKGSQMVWVLDTATGDLWPDDTIPNCEDCQFSFDYTWEVGQRSGDLVVSRPDGSLTRVLFTANESPVWPAEVHWLGLHTLEYRYWGYLPDRYLDSVLLIQRLDPANLVTPTPFLPLPGIRVNELLTEIVAEQPGGGSLAVVRTGFDTGSGQGYKYYLYDRATNTADYFARLAGPGSNSLDVTWHPLGTALYYRYPDSQNWYIFDPVSRKHHLLGTLPGGIWSREGRFRAEWFSLPDEERQARQEANQPLLKLSVWDTQTGLIRRYCLPDTEDRTLDGETLYWSPDSRFLAFSFVLPKDADYESAPRRTFVLDTQTGAMTELTTEVASIIVWTDSVPERK